MKGRDRREGNLRERAKVRTQGRVALPPNLQRVNEAAKRDKQARFTALLHHVDVAALERAFRRLKRNASAGVDGETVASYEQNLPVNLQELCERVHRGRYRPWPVRRVYIPKADGGQRPLGVPALEDKVVQGAVAEVLSAIYEADFLGFSYGFRPGRNPHQALTALHTAVMTQCVNWVLDTDIRKFFDSVDHEWLLRMIGHRIADPRVLRLIQQWLKAGVLESGEWHETVEGTPQGFVVKRKTQSRRLTAKLKSLREEARRRMHAAVSNQHQWLSQVLRGHYAYYGLPSNFRSLNAFYLNVRRTWFWTLRRRSQRRMSWAGFNELHERFPLPTPWITRHCAA